MPSQLSETTFKIPPTDSTSFKFGFAELIDFNLDNNADHDYAILAPTQVDQTDVIHVTWKEFGRAIHRGAHILNPLDKPLGSGKAIGIIAVTDSLLYYALVGAVMRSGNIPLPISNRNTAPAIINLLEKTSCHHILYNRVANSVLAQVAQQVRREVDEKHYELNVIPIPTIEELFPNLGKDIGDDNKFKPYPVLSSVELDDPAMILHSSGSTGFPKPITLTQRYLFGFLLMPIVRDMQTPTIVGSVALPAFHLLGLATSFITPISNGATIALWAPSNPPPVPTPETTMRAFKAVGCTIAIAAPSFLVSWSREEEAVKVLSGMRHVIFAGGPLPLEIGDMLVEKGVRLTSVLGGTEFGTISKLSIERDPHLWSWLEFTDQVHIRWVPQEGYEPGTCEMQIIDVGGDKFSPMVHNITTDEGLAGYATSDLYVPHPTIKGLYRIVGRLDDQIIMATGEKVNPGPIEDIILHNNLIDGAILLGRAQNQVGILVEPVEPFDPTDEKKLAAFRNKIWPSVEAANRTSATFARIFKELILPTSPDKPLPRTPKGTVIHKLAVRLYESEIKTLYDAVAKAKGDDVPLPKSWSEKDVGEWLQERADEIMEHKIDNARDLFEQGADSLTATYLRNRIYSAMSRSEDPVVKEASKNISQNIIFTNPTLALLTKHVSSLARSPKGVTADTVEEAVSSMKELIDRYSATLPTGPHLPHETVLLTGTTGALGSLLLAKLLSDERVERVWAVNRRSSGLNTIEQRQTESFRDKDLDVTLLTRFNGTRLIYVEADLSAEMLGLEKHLYHDITSSTTLIIHNAWRLDFNLSVSSFESNIKGTRNLIDVALASPLDRYTRLFFTSSVATLASWPNTKEPSPEEPIPDAHISVGNGYGESKYVSEKIIEQATIKAGLPSTIFRIGQLSGSDNGYWSTTDWVPNLVTSSIQLGCLPDAVGTASWLPLHHAAQAICDIGLERDKPLDQTLHLFHPRPTSWTNMFTAISKALGPVTEINGQRQNLPLVPISEWFKKLEALPSTEMTRVPGLKLLSFYRALAMGDEAVRKEGLQNDGKLREAMGQPRLMVTKIQRASRTMREVEQINEGDVNAWIKYWRSKGLFA